MYQYKQTRFLPALFLLLGIFFSQFISAQGYIDEDFLENLYDNAAPMLKESRPAFEVKEIPKKWENESAVIIGYSRSVLFDRKNSGGFFSRRERSLYFFEKTRFRVRVIDNNSVESLSTIYFRYGSKEDGFIARIIKSGDTAVNIDLKSAVAVERGSSIPQFFQSFFDKVAYSEYQYYKVPIANLEPGDILEYVTTTKSRLDVTSSGYVEFEPAYEVCSKQYPILHNEITIETDDKSYFKSLSLNGAPTFKKEGTSENGFFKYVFVDKDRAVEKDVNFVSPFLQYPFVKFQVIYSNKEEAKGLLIGARGELKSSFSRQELARKAWEDYEMMGNQTMGSTYTIQMYVTACWAELIKLGAKGMTEKEYINTAYYFLRNKIVFMRDYMSDKQFAYIFGSLLYQRNIESEIVITSSNNIGLIHQTLFDEEIRYVIKVGDKLYFNATDFSNPGELMESLLDNEAMIIYKPAKKGGAQEIKDFKLPGTSAIDNSSQFAIRVLMSDDMKGVKVRRISTYSGISKSKEIGDALKYTTYMIDDYKSFGGDDPTVKMKGKQVEEYETTIRTLKDEYNKQKPEYVKNALGSEFRRRVTNAKFTLTTDGRTEKSKLLTFSEEFEFPDFVRQAGKKYLLNLPALIGPQLQIKDEERTRDHDIDVRFPKKFNWTVEFKIPSGYKAEGLNELNQSVDNETGAFSIKAREENGLIKIDIEKIYKAKKVDKAKWNEMLAFIDAAYASTFKYILLTPTK
ncbi:MAG: hypothetical protein ABW174_05390 [Flavitalea sp.]